MFLLRIIAILTVVVIGSSILAWLFTRNSAYLVLAFRVLKGALAFSLFVLLLLFAERLIIL